MDGRQSERVQEEEETPDRGQKVLIAEENLSPFDLPRKERRQRANLMPSCLSSVVLSLSLARGRLLSSQAL